MKRILLICAFLISGCSLHQKFLDYQSQGKRDFYARMDAWKGRPESELTLQIGVPDRFVRGGENGPSTYEYQQDECIEVFILEHHRIKDWDFRGHCYRTL